MANCSDFKIELSGPLFRLKAMYDEFMRLTPRYFQISEIHKNHFTKTIPFTWTLEGVGRWSIDMDQVCCLAMNYSLSGTITDAEDGADFFNQIQLTDGEITDSCYANFLSDEHFRFCNDPKWWLEYYNYVLEDPDDYPEIVEFLLKHNIITKEDLNGQS